MEVLHIQQKTLVQDLLRSCYKDIMAAERTLLMPTKQADTLRQVNVGENGIHILVKNCIELADLPQTSTQQAGKLDLNSQTSTPRSCQQHANDGRS